MKSSHTYTPYAQWTKHRHSTIFVLLNTRLYLFSVLPGVCFRPADWFWPLWAFLILGDFTLGAHTTTSWRKALVNHVIHVFYVCLLSSGCLGQLGERVWKKLDTWTGRGASFHSILGIWLLARHHFGIAHWFGASVVFFVCLEFFPVLD